jgi:transposase
MDTSEQIIVDESPKTKVRLRRSIEEKRRIVEETLRPGASVARVARRHAVSANQIFYWRKKYREGCLSESGKLLPVTLTDNTVSKLGRMGYAPSPSAGSMEIKLAKGTVRIAGNVDAVVLRTAIECLLG